MEVPAITENLLDYRAATLVWWPRKKGKCRWGAEKGTL